MIFPNFQFHTFSWSACTECKSIRDLQFFYFFWDEREETENEGRLPNIKDFIAVILHYIYLHFIILLKINKNLWLNCWQSIFFELRYTKWKIFRTHQMWGCKKLLHMLETFHVPLHFLSQTSNSSYFFFTSSVLHRYFFI